MLLQVGKTEQLDRQLDMQKGMAFMLRLTRRMHEGVLRKQDHLGRVSRDQFACLLPRIAGGRGNARRKQGSGRAAGADAAG